VNLKTGALGRVELAPGLKQNVSIPLTRQYQEQAVADASCSSSNPRQLSILISAILAAAAERRIPV